jgi:hypothetical protein
MTENYKPLTAAIERIRDLFTKAEDRKKAQPDDHLTDDKERYCPLRTLSAVEIARDAFVNSTVDRAEFIVRLMACFKEDTHLDIDAFIQKAADDYEIEMGGAKGNLTLFNFDGTAKVCLRFSNKFVFNEKLQIAKQLLDKVIAEEKEKGTLSDVVVVMINEAFAFDTEKSVNYYRLIKLTKHEGIKNENWQKAMAAIKECTDVIGKTAYLQFYRRDKDKPKNKAESWRPILLDLAKV